MSDIKVNVKTLAYERTHPKDSLSQFINDADFATKSDVDSKIELLRQWILETYKPGIPSVPVYGGPVEATDISNPTPITRSISAGDIVDRVAPVEDYFYSGNVISIKHKEGK